MSNLQNLFFFLIFYFNEASHCNNAIKSLGSFGLVRMLYFWFGSRDVSLTVKWPQKWFYLNKS